MMTATQILKPADLGLILSYHCQCACAHCLFNCGPFWSEWISAGDIELALQATRAWEQPPQIHFTGGEPFLNFPLLVHATQVAVELDIPCYVETDAGWCVREDLVVERFSSLREHGLRAILISCSPFHAEMVPPKRTLLAIAVAIEIFGVQGVMINQLEWLDQLRRFGFENTTPLAYYIESYGPQPAGVMFWQGYGLISGGRSGYRLGHLADRRPASAFSRSDCQAELLQAHHSHFDLYGNYISSSCAGLSIGSWKNLPEFLAGFDEDRLPPLAQILVRAGPYGLYEMARAEFGYRALKGGYAGKCHLCVDVRRHLYRFDRFEELQPGQFYQELERAAGR